MWRFEDPSCTPSKETFSIYSETGDRKRKRHSKSQNGCEFCRKRRIKCSEHRPKCAYCSRLQKVCQYRLPQKQLPANRRPNIQSPPLQNPNRDQCLVIPTFKAHILTALAIADAHDADLLDYSRVIRSHSLELLDHFIRYDRSWLKNESIQNVMQGSASCEVIANGYLLYAALAVSAAHLALLRPDHRTLKTLSLVLWQRAIRSYSPRLVDVDSQNADVLFFASHLHSMLATVNGSSMHDCNEWELPNWVLSLRGVKAIWDSPAVMAGLRGGIWGDWVVSNGLQYQQLVDRLSTRPPHTPSRIIAFLRTSCAFLPPGEQPLYQCRIAVLELLESSTPSSEATNLLSWFITRAKPECIAHLKKGHELALLTLLYWFKIAARLGQWWLAVAAETEFERLKLFLLRTNGYGKVRMILEAMDDA